MTGVPLWVSRFSRGSMEGISFALISSGCYKTPVFYFQREWWSLVKVIQKFKSMAQISDHLKNLFYQQYFNMMLFGFQHFAN